MEKDIKTIKTTVTKSGQVRAYYWNWFCCRWMPMKLAEAELLYATGQAELVKDF